MRIFFFFNDTATTEIYTLSLHDALPISRQYIGGKRRISHTVRLWDGRKAGQCDAAETDKTLSQSRSEEHTSELQSLAYLVCRLLLEKKKKIYNIVGCLLNRTRMQLVVYL